MIDQPSLMNGTNTVNFNSLQQPKFDKKFIPAIGAMVMYPIFDDVSLQASINAYFTEKSPASWNATLGVSMNLAVISQFFSTVTK